jgi:hypothetical protein
MPHGDNPVVTGQSATSSVSEVVICDTQGALLQQFHLLDIPGRGEFNWVKSGFCRRVGMGKLFLIAIGIVSFNLQLAAAQDGAPDCQGQAPTIIGTDKSDSINGTIGPDVIVGLGGDDNIKGLDGNDVICGGDGNDTITGSGGDDILYGDAGNDDLRGGKDNDVVYGGDGDDYIEGNDGEDFLDGGAGTDSIDAGKGQDKCINYESNKRCNVD